MKKILSLMLLVLSIAATASADRMDRGPGYLVPGYGNGPGHGRPPVYDPGHDGHGYGPGYGHDHHGPGYDPGYRPGPGWDHRPPMPPPPPPSYNDVYGPSYTVRWQDAGTNRAEKIIDLNVYVNAQGQFVNEVLLTAQENMVQIKSAQARLANGQMVNLPQLAVTIGQDQQLRIRLDNYYSLKVDQIILTVRSPNIFGSRGKLNVQLGLAY